MTANFPTTIQFHPQSTKLKLRFCPYRQTFIVTAPPRTSKRLIDGFLVQSQTWMANQLLKDQSTPSALHLGDILPILGDSYQLLHDPLRRKGVFEEENILRIGGKSSPQANELEKLLVLWLRKRAHGFFLDQAPFYAEQIGAIIRGIRVRQTISRWGSCSSNGSLSFNWRLILAPEEVAQYVCIHEVCHLKEMNHSPDFWKLVEQLMPSYEIQRLWLKRKGKSLYKLFPLDNRAEEE